MALQLISASSSPLESKMSLLLFGLQHRLASLMLLPHLAARLPRQGLHPLTCAVDSQDMTPRAELYAAR